MVWEHTLHNLYSLKFVQMCFMAQNVVSLSKYSRCLLGWTQDVTRMSIRFSWLIALSSLTTCSLIFRLLDLSVTDSGMLKSLTTIVDISRNNSGFIFFSMPFYRFLPHVFWIPVHTYSYMIKGKLNPLSLCNAPLYHCVKGWCYFFKYSIKCISEAIWLLYGKI